MRGNCKFLLYLGVFDNVSTSLVGNASWASLLSPWRVTCTRYLLIKLRSGFHLSVESNLHLLFLLHYTTMLQVISLKKHVTLSFYQKSKINGHSNSNTFLCTLHKLHAFPLSFDVLPNCLCPFWLARVISLVWVLQTSVENCSNELV